MSTYKKMINVTSKRDFWIGRFTSIALVLFAASLPFNGIEWNWMGVERLELKITMITFTILFIAWFLKNNILQEKWGKNAKEKLFYLLALIYASSQFLSLINSPYPLESLKQAGIMVSLLTMMIVVSETVLSRETVLSVLKVMGVMALIIATAGVLTYYFIDFDYSARLGRMGTKFMGIIDLGGDPYYFGDILLFSSGAVFFLTMQWFEKWQAKLIGLALLFLWFSALVLTYTKGLIAAVVSFLLIALFLLKGKRSFIFLCFIVFITAVIVNTQLNGYMQINKLEQKNIVPKESESIKMKKNLSTVQLGSDLFLREKLSAASPNVLGSNSLYFRLKLVEVSMIKSMDHFWFGHGAGLSEKLLPPVMFKEINIPGADSSWNYKEAAERNLIDSHVLFITEFFNAGIVGALSLTCLILFILIELFSVVKTSLQKTDYIPALLFATIISMLIFRFFGSLIVIPFLWFMLGLAFGVCKIYGGAKAGRNTNNCA